MGVFAATPGNPQIVGHRGVRLPGIAENTPPAFAQAAHDGAQWVELDVRRSADGVPVVYHNGYTPDQQPVVSRTAAELETTFGICSFAAVLDAMPSSLGINVE